jgi:DNA repair protein RadC
MISHVKTDAQGQKCFEDAELIAILIGSGRNESAVDLSKRILV